MPVVFVKVPEAHGVDEDWPVSSTNEPVGAGEHAVEPDALWKVPLSHGAHTSLPNALL